MTAPQTGVYPGAVPYPPPPPTQPVLPEPPTRQELARQHMVALGFLFVLTAMTLGVSTSSIEVFWDALRFFLVLYTIGAWIAFSKSWLTSVRR
ncbi:MAG: hypothetical protein M3313_11405 [Actinomycetota bacterium]|nr:hypothetical protein [Actinomycetota bacterium]